jgi:hypothetical protein
MEINDKGSENKEVIDEIRLLLDEKRTSISILSTGIFILLAQLLIYSILIATSKFYEIANVLHMIIPFYIVTFIILRRGRVWSPISLVYNINDLYTR